jgi:NAD-dependent DNA ligase
MECKSKDKRLMGIWIVNNEEAYKIELAGNTITTTGYLPPSFKDYLQAQGHLQHIQIRRHVTTTTVVAVVGEMPSEKVVEQIRRRNIPVVDIDTLLEVIQEEYDA